MDDVERISMLIGDIYDAALDPALWPTVLEQTATYVGGVCAAVVAQEPSAGSGAICFSASGSR